MSEKIQYGIDPDEYVKNNPFMEYTNMKIEKISPECSEISMKITHGVTKGILVRRGRTITIVRSEVTDEKGNLLADVTVDMFCLGEK